MSTGTKGVRLKRLTGYLVIAGIWALLLGLLGIFGTAYVVYADLKDPERSHLTRTGGGFLALVLYERLFTPMWATPPAAQFDPEIIYKPKPGRSLFAGPEFSTWINITEDGVRAQPGGSDVSAEGGLVVMAGDSFTFGWGVEDEQTFPAILQTRFHHRTVNTGVPSYGTARELFRLRSLGLLAKASVLVIQYCQNDQPENHEFVQNGRVFTRDPKLTWMAMGDYSQAEVTYAHVLGGMIGYSLERLGSDSLRHLLRDIVVGNRYSRRQYYGDNAIEAVEFLAVLDRFPELAGKRIIVTEMNAPEVRTTFLEELKKRIADRPNMQVVPVALAPADHFRFDMHLRASGNEKIAAELDKAIRREAAEALPHPR